jgi:hypothetical protein
MGPFALLLLALAGWMLWTGRLQRMNVKDGVVLAIAVLGAITAAKGKPLIGALPIFASLGYAAWRMRGDGDREAGNGTIAAPDAIDESVAEAYALLGLPRDADPDAIRAAHRRLIASVHPDRGGTEALAARINAARDLLLRQHEK